MISNDKDEAERLFSWLYRPDRWDHSSSSTKRKMPLALSEAFRKSAREIPPKAEVISLLTQISAEMRPHCVFFFRPRIEDLALADSFAKCPPFSKVFVFGPSGFIEKPLGSPDLEAAQEFSNTDLLDFLGKSTVPVTPILSGGLPTPVHSTSAGRSSILIGSSDEFNLQLEFEKRKIPGMSLLFACRASILHSFVALPVFQNTINFPNLDLDLYAFKRQLLIEGGFTIRDCEFK